MSLTDLDYKSGHRKHIFYKYWLASRPEGVTLKEEKPAEEEFKPINDDDALVKEANLVIAEYGWLQIGRIKKGFINFQVQSVKEYFVLKCYRQKQYKPDHKELSFGKVSDKVKSKVKPKKWGLIERLPNAVKHSRPPTKLSRKNINVSEMKNVPEAYPDFLSNEPTTTLVCSP
ncbi:7135_t:CDS:2, partial [Cetraspora pellucida]